MCLLSAYSELFSLLIHFVSYLQESILILYIIMEQIELKSVKIVLHVSVINLFSGRVFFTIRHSSVLPDKHTFLKEYKYHFWSCCTWYNHCIHLHSMSNVTFLLALPIHSLIRTEDESVHRFFYWIVLFTSQFSCL